jgi:VWFA-related protein
MSYLNVRPLKDRRFGTAVLAVFCGPLLATLCFSITRSSNSGKSDSGQEKVTLIIHVSDQHGTPIASNAVRDIQVIEHGKKLQVVDGPKSAGPKRIALLLDSNFHQQKVLPLEQQTALELLSEFRKEKAQAIVTSYGTEIHSSGNLTDDFEGLKTFTVSLRAETAKHDETVLLFDAMKRAFEKLDDGPGTKAVIVFAEGNDHGSTIGWGSLARLAQRAHIACYVVLFADHSFYGPKAIRRYGWDLAELAPKTGGRLWEVGNNPGKAREIAQRLALMLDGQAVIEVLVPEVRLNRFHPLKVSSPDYRISAQTGYFDDGIR